MLAVASTSLAAAGPAAAQEPPTCFGAPAMDPARPCVDRSVTVTPTVAGVDDEPLHKCRQVGAPKGVRVCAFGASTSRAKRSFALVGDSHTFAWRAALSDIGAAQGWRGYSLAAPACIFSEAAKALPPIPRDVCLPAYNGALRWLRQHREVDVVITTHEADTVLKVPRGKTLDGLKIAGFRRTWKAFPAHVRRVIVLRDTPNASAEELACVAQVAAAAVTPPGPICALPRAWTLTEDVAVQAAQGLRSPRYSAVDMTDLICSPALCFPAVGGVLVNRDKTGHVTQTFARSAEPYLLSRLQPLLPPLRAPR